MIEKLGSGICKSNAQLLKELFQLMSGSVGKFRVVGKLAFKLGHHC
jgi:hypothetical protein